MKKKNIYKVVIALALAMSLTALSVPSFAGQVTAAPALMPNFPMLAGANVMIMWVPVPGAVKYKIYQNGKPIGEAPAPPFSAPAPAEPGVYKYKITGVDAAGEEGPASREGELAIIKMVQPGGFTARFLGEVLNIRWDKVPNASIYDVFRADKAEGPYKLITSTTEQRYVDSDIKQNEDFFGKSMFYKVVSIDKFNTRSPDTEYNEYKIERPAKVAEEAPDIILKIRRTKQVRFAKPMGGGTDLMSVSGCDFTQDKKEMIYTDTFGHRIGVLDEFGDWTRDLAEVGPKEGQIGSPGAVKVDDSDGTVFIVDTQKLTINAFSENGALLWSVTSHIAVEDEALGKFEDRRKQNFARLSGMAIHKGELLIVDTASGTVQRYDKASGDFLGYFTNKETGEIPTFGAPAYLALGDNGKLYIGRPLERIVNCFDVETGVQLYNLGVSKSFIGAFAAVTGVDFDEKGDVLVTDATMHSTQVFSKEDGSYLYHIGGVKAIPDNRSKDQRPFVPGLDAPFSPMLDYKGRLWIYNGVKKGFSVREYVSDNIWDGSVDKPEGESPK